MDLPVPWISQTPYASWVYNKAFGEWVRWSCQPVSSFFCFCCKDGISENVRLYLENYDDLIGKTSLTKQFLLHAAEKP